MAINQQLLAARKRMHWSQQRAADTCNVGLQTFFRWENGIQLPHGYNLERLCEVFGASAEQLGYAPEENEAEEGDSSVDYSKRNTLRTILTTATSLAAAVPLSLIINPEPWERLASTKPAAINPDTIQHFDSLLHTSRALSNGNELNIANRLLDTFLPRLRQASSHQLEVAGLTSQALVLKSIFAAHNLQVGEKIALCQAAVEQAKQSQSPSLIIMGLLQLGVAYHYAQQQDQALKVQQEALYYVGQTSPLVQSHTYAELSATLAQFHRVREADFYMNFAYETFPQSPTQDPNFAIDDHWFGNLTLYKGIMYTHLAQPKAAWDAFEEHKIVTNTPERIRLEIKNNQGGAALALGHLDEYVACLQDGLAGAVMLGSKKRFDEAVNIFQKVPNSWRKEPQLRSIIEQYSLPAQI